MNLVQDPALEQLLVANSHLSGKKGRADTDASKHKKQQDTIGESN